MGFYTILSASIQGIKVEMIQVEVDVGNGLPVFHMVGFLASEVKEAAERVRTAKDILIQAQQDAEELYISANE